MNALFDSMSGGSLPFLLDMSLKTGAILLLALATTTALRSASASLRHHVWTLAFASVLALPFLAASLPAWQVSLPGWSASTPVNPVPASTDWTLATAERLAIQERPGNGQTLAGVPAARRSATATPTREGPLGWGLVRTIMIVWLAGVALMLARLAIGVTAACWTSRQADELDHVEWRRLVDELSEELRIGKRVRLLTSSSISTPMAWGIFRPALLLPSDADTWSEDRRRAVVLHELAHIRRRDCLVHLVAQAARAVHWFNPLAWVGATRLRAERERACDDLVLTSGTRSADYAKLLLDVARGRMDRSLAWATVSMARPSELEGRLLAILDPARDRRGMGRPAAVAAIGLAAGVMLPLAAFQAAPEPPEPPAASEPAFVPLAPRGPEPASAPLAPEPPKWEGHFRAPAPEPGPRPGPEPRTAPLPRVIDSAPMAEMWLPGSEPRLRAPEPPIADTLEERAAAAMIKALGSDRARIRSKAAHALGSLESPAAVGPLGGAARGDESADVRAQAVWALGMIQDPQAVADVSAALSDPETRVRSQAAWALGMIESAEAVPALLPALRDESARVRSQAAWALGMIESAEAVDGLMAALGSDESNDVRRQSAWALGMIEHPDATDALIDAIEDEDDEVAEQAMWALGRVMGQ